MGPGVVEMATMLLIVDDLSSTAVTCLLWHGQSDWWIGRTAILPTLSSATLGSGVGRSCNSTQLDSTLGQHYLMLALSLIRFFLIIVITRVRVARLGTVYGTTPGTTMSLLCQQKALPSFWSPSQA